MSSSSRQHSLLAAEDWKKIYQTFREADFQSYDFETLRKSMIDYLKLYYPEDFNDFIESSEYIALIDLIAFLGQSLAFRSDLNARESFIDTAERRDSILKLARLINYSPKRSIPASGFLKIESISTSEKLTDSTGVSITGLPITWNDTTNNNWLEQFTLIIDATLIDNQTIGKSGNSQLINGITNSEYTVNLTTGTQPVFAFNAIVNGAQTPFEIVSATSIGQQYIYEVPPIANNRFNLLYRNDNQGNGSINTGFFLHFKQGALSTLDFNLEESLANRVLTVGYNGINNSDIWLYSLDVNGNVDVKWAPVPTVAGINVIYNKSVDKNLFQINTTVNDNIDLVFGDGAFSNIPVGNFRLYFRTGNAQAYKILPTDVQNASFLIPYVSRDGNVETLSIFASLNYTVSNAAASETSEEIRQKAPQQFYTQGRMVTGEDYNIVPYTNYANIAKVKAVNRSSSGVSRFIDVNDSSGKYSSTNIFAQDGVLYKTAQEYELKLSFLNTNTIGQIISDTVTNILNTRELLHRYYDEVTAYQYPNAEWVMSSLNIGGSTGYFNNISTGQILQLGNITSTAGSHIKVGALIKFTAGPEKYFNAQNVILQGVPKYDGDKLYIYASVVSVLGDGTNGGAGTMLNGQGPVTLSIKVPTGAAVHSIIPRYSNTLTTKTIQEMVTAVAVKSNFYLKYNAGQSEWEITIGNAYDNDWLIKFENVANVGYSVFWRGLSYIFESTKETKFYYDNKVKIYDSKTDTVIQDNIKFLKVNTQPLTSLPIGLDYRMNILSNITEADGYVNQNKVTLTFTDNNADGIPDDPYIYKSLVDSSNIVFFKKVISYDSFIQWEPFDSSLVVTLYTSVSEIPISQYSEGEVFYIQSTTPEFYVLMNLQGAYSLVRSTDYVAKNGRGSLYFQYMHNSPGNNRIDPSPNNIIDIYVLTKEYAEAYSLWIKDTTGKIEEPQPPTTEELSLAYAGLQKLKAISDTIVLSSAKFKPLFGPTAELSLQATFKVVKNAAVNISDNEIKSRVITAVNNYFDTANWDFGESFYFSELSAYLHATLSPAASSIIIVPVDAKSLFGNLYQINAEANELLTSSATVANVEIISAITAATLNANVAG